MKTSAIPGGIFGRCADFGVRFGFLLAFFWAAVCAGQPRLEILRFESRILKGNPLHDPAVRNVAIFVPAQCTNGGKLPLIYFLPGWGGSPENFIQASNKWLRFTQKFADEVMPATLVVVDGRTRWGGSQYLNSPAQGNYSDYVCREIVPIVEARHPAPASGVRRVVAGHSSGGFGALRLGMANHDLFDGVVALSPDSDFQVTHLPLVKLPGVTHASLAEVKAIAALQLPRPKDGDLTYAIGLCAAYSPRRFLRRGQFDWLYDARGRFRERVWKRWLRNDPLTLARKNPSAFAARQRVYLDGAAQDEYLANVGARKIYEVLRQRPARCAFDEPSGKHGEHVPDRLTRGLAWVLGQKNKNGSTLDALP